MRAQILRRAWPAVFCLGVLAAGGTALAQSEIRHSERHDFRVVTLAEGLEHPWAMAFLPDGGILITERPGRLRLWRNGKIAPAPIAGTPEVAAVGQGGLLDVALDPDFANNKLVYLSFAGAGPGGAGTEVARARYDETGLQNLEPLLAVAPKSDGGRHFGSRLAFGSDGLLYVTAGERGSPERSQDPSDMAGSVLRIRPDGTVPADNPFVGQSGADPRVFSYGHRNPQGLTRHPETGRIWAVEHGPRGGDELNLIAPGVNYGWPVITHGISYAGFPIGEGSAKPGMAQPVRYWVPSISPSGMSFYDGAAFPRWQGSLFIGALSARLLARLEFDGDTVRHEERLLEDMEARIRDVRQGPDGLIYLLTDAPDGALLRLEPAD
jgi:glucose/arabinose dehydrogenase